MGKLQYPGGAGEAGPPFTGPMIVRTASLKLLTKEFDKTREALEGVIRRHRGYSAQLTVGSESGSAHTLSATFRVPADRLDAAIAEIKQLAHVEQESQGGEEVTEQYVDLTARLSNARRTEQTLLDILEKRTGRLADVLEVEQELARVREEIERMEGELKSLQNRLSYATLRVELREEYKAELEMTPPSVGGRMRNALVEGYRAAVDSLVGLVLLLLNVGPFLLLWALILFWPARYVWRQVRAAKVQK
jgi:chromosome segregation ATPase